MVFGRLDVLGKGAKFCKKKQVHWHTQEKTSFTRHCHVLDWKWGALLHSWIAYCVSISRAGILFVRIDLVMNHSRRNIYDRRYKYLRNPMKGLIASPIAFEAVCSYLGAWLFNWNKLTRNRSTWTVVFRNSWFSGKKFLAKLQKCLPFWLLQAHLWYFP